MGVLDLIVITAVLGGSAGLLVVRAVRTWWDFRTLRRTTDLLAESAKRLERSDEGHR